MYVNAIQVVQNLLVGIMLIYKPPPETNQKLQYM